MHQRDARLLRQVRDYITKNLHRPLSVATICREFNTNKTTLQERFREYLGSSLHAYILEQRMERARVLLIETDDPVKYVAGQCGYQKVHSFNKAFRNKYLRSPGGYRKNFLAVKSDINAVESHTV
jgi:AraC-like DNA-binding protein